MDNTEEDTDPLSLGHSDFIIEKEVIYISSDDGDDGANDDFYVPRPVQQFHNQDASQLLISTDASCNKLTAAGSCVILNDVTFGSQTRTLPVVPADDSLVAELVAMTEAVRLGCQLVQGARRMGDCKVKTLHIVSDCAATVNWRNAP